MAEVLEFRSSLPSWRRAEGGRPAALDPAQPRSLLAQVFAVLFVYGPRPAPSAEWMVDIVLSGERRAFAWWQHAARAIRLIRHGENGFSVKQMIDSKIITVAADPAQVGCLRCSFVVEQMRGIELYHEQRMQRMNEGDLIELTVVDADNHERHL